MLRKNLSLFARCGSHTTQRVESFSLLMDIGARETTATYIVLVSTFSYVWVGPASENFPRRCVCRQFQPVIGVKSMLIVRPGLVHEDANRQEYTDGGWTGGGGGGSGGLASEGTREELMGTNCRSGYSLEPC